MFSELLCSAWVEEGVHFFKRGNIWPHGPWILKTKRKNFQANRFEKISYHVFKILTQSLLHSLTKSRKRPSPLPLTQIRWRKIKPLPQIAKPPSLNCYSCAQKTEIESDCDEFKKWKDNKTLIFDREKRSGLIYQGHSAYVKIKKICYESCMKMFQNESHRIEIKHILPKIWFLLFFFFVGSKT